MRCDIIAEGIISASKELSLTVPIVVRLQGTNVNEGRDMINRAKLKVIVVDDFAKAAEAAVKLALLVNVSNSLNLDIALTYKEKSAETDKGKCAKTNKGKSAKKVKKSKPSK